MNGASPGQCNIVVKDHYETFDHQIPVEEFVNQLEGGNILDKVCVIGLGDAFESGEATNLGQVLRDRSDDLKDEGATIQFAVEGSFQRVKGGYELKYGDNLYRLDRVFGARLTEEGDGWLVTPY